MMYPHEAHLSSPGNIPKIYCLRVELRQPLKWFQESFQALCGLKIFMIRLFRHRVLPQSRSGQLDFPTTYIQNLSCFFCANA